MSVQGPDRDYAFHTLGWFQFESLCRTVLSDLFGQTVAHYSPGSDAGIDAAFSGTWEARPGELYSGTFTMQVKFSRQPRSPLTMSILADDCKRALQLRSNGYLDNYLIITNHAVTGPRKLALEGALKAKLGIGSVNIFGSDWLSHRIATSSHLRMLVPRVYGLGDLGEILDERAYEQARTILSWMPALRTIVTTSTMQDAARMLKKHRFVLLVGDAMVGKTTAAGALAIAALDDLKLRVLKIPNATAFVRHWNALPSAQQFFWIDDAFGDTSYDESLTKSWGRHLDELGAALAAGACIVMTSRSYIWNRAKDVIKTYAFEPFRNNKVVIRLEDLSDTERQQMLYNHLRMGDQPHSFKKRLQPMLQDIAKVRPFYPEVARRLASPSFTKSLTLDKPSVLRFFEKPAEMLIDIISRLSAAEKALLTLVFANGGRIEAPIPHTDETERTAALFGASLQDLAESVAHMLDVYITLEIELDGTESYRFTHPSFSDAVAAMTAQRREWLDVYFSGASIHAILRDTHAGRPGEQGVQIAVPSTSYASLVSRLVELSKRPGSFWTSYLSRRSGASFLGYVSEHAPNLFDEDYYYDEEPDPRDDDYFRLCAKLVEYNLLTEEMRRRAVDRVRRYSHISVTFIDDPLLSGLVTPEDRKHFFAELMVSPEELLDRMRDYLDEGYSTGDRPEDFYQPAFDYIDDLEGACIGNASVAKACASARSQLERRIADLEEDIREKEQRGEMQQGYRSALGFSITPSVVPQVTEGVAQRNIFSDVADPN